METDNESKRTARERAHSLIPGGCHTYAKGDDQYPVSAPAFIVRGKGCHIWDSDGNRYIEYGMGNRAVTLGHAFPAVIEAAQKELLNGANFARPSLLEGECAEAFLQTIPTAEMVKFCKDGSDATSGAVKLARAYTGRDLIACCAEHPFFSVDDWFIGTTEMNAGIPEVVQKLTLRFHYNDLTSAAQLFETNPGQIAGLIIEPARLEEPKDRYLQKLSDLCHAHGALLIFDEMISGFRWANAGAQSTYGVVPDLSCWGKALANGFSVSALAGKREYMSLGGLTRTDRPRVFLLSTTHGAETHGLAAAMATMRIYAEEPVVEHLYRQGERLRAGIEGCIIAHGLSDHVQVVGRACCLVYGTKDANRAPSQAFRSLLLQETIKRGVLMPSLVVSYSHTDDDIDRTVEAINGALRIYAQALDDGVERFLIGRPSEVVYRRYNKPCTDPAAVSGARDSHCSADRVSR